MINIVIKSILIFFTANFLFLNLAHSLNQITGKVVKIADGDTITVVQDKKEYKIRLYGIDTPEKSQWYGKNATAFTSAQVMDKKVSVQKVDIDRYGRIVGIVSIGDLILNQHLIEFGYAWVYHKYCTKPICAEWTTMEEQARINEKGLWKNPDVIPPWKYRHGGKTKKKPDYSGPYHGNINSNVFHAPWCKYYNCKNCKKVLPTRAAAVSSGYRPCGICNP